MSIITKEQKKKEKTQHPTALVPPTNELEEVQVFAALTYANDNKTAHSRCISVGCRKNMQTQAYNNELWPIYHISIGIFNIYRNINRYFTINIKMFFIDISYQSKKN